VSTFLLSRYVAARVLTATAPARLGRALRIDDRLHDERGEGVISAALAVLIMAFLGALMWVVFKDMFTTTTSKTKGQVDLIGQ
jgi:hypothetical protein